MHFSFKQPEVPFHLILASMIWLFSFGGLQAQEKANLTSTAEFGGKWGTKVEEAIKALELKGNIEDGQIIYEEICEACHQPGGNGDPAGNLPSWRGSSRPWSSSKLRISGPATGTTRRCIPSPTLKP